MAIVDPFVHPIPRKLTEDAETRAFFEYFVRWAHDIWKRSGGGTDSLEVVAGDVINQEVTFTQAIEQNIEDIEELNSVISSLKRQNKAALQLINELTERVDSGT